MTASIARLPVERPERAPYRLKREPDGRAWTARENLADILDRELLGPANGPDELLNGPPDAAYLVGRIAPAKLLAGDADPTDADDPDGATDVGDAVDAEEGRGVPVASGGDGGDAGDESGADDEGIDDRPQQRGLMIPASMGLRLQIPHDLDAFTVTASWGTYRAARDEGDEGRRSRRYQRTPVEITTTVTVADLRLGATTTFVLQDKVVLRVDRYDSDACRLVEVALCNDRVTPRRIPVDAWLYQTRLDVAAGGAAVFLPVSDPLVDDVEEPDDELRRLRLQYRDRLEFAVGRTCSVDWDVAPGERRATAVRTTWLPVCETPQTTAEEVSGALLDMQELATADRAELDAGLRPIVQGYRSWLNGEEQRATALPAHLRPDAEEAIHEARRVADQLADGLAHLLDESEAEALRCFRFMNHVMAEQRIQSQVAERRAAHPKASIAVAREAVLAKHKERAHSWRTFQLAFILTQLPLLSNPAAPRRSGDLARAQLLFFPTGGGKTEAYLGLAAYTFAVRRRQGVLNTVDGPLDGRDGVAVLMRYTLRLLTAQQFQRATALVCAAELARRADPETWGAEPFRIGLWVGTDVSPKWWDEADDQLKNVHDGRRHRLTVLQIQRCPWCGSRIDPKDVTAVRSTRRVLVRCSDDRGSQEKSDTCPFAAGREVAEGLPVLTVDEEIYRLAPAFVIATVDKFARLAREGAAAALFGYVARRCGRHGYVHPDYRFCDLKEGGKHQATKDGLPPAGVYPVARLRPPDLVIQDELHLITGALGTTVGLFEVAVDVLTVWRDPAGRPVRPLLVASTATARNAPDQVRALYGRGVTIFPPQVLDAGRTFFSRDEPVSEKFPGRRYVGISTTGVRLTTAEIRVAEILMAGAQELLDRDGPTGSAADPYLTLVGYFSAMRELAGMARYLGDDVQTALRNGRRWSALPRRRGTTFRQLHVAELTSRVASADITGTLDQMALGFDPRFDTDAGRRALIAEREAGRPVPRRDTAPFDAVLATSMLQVGVDVTRLGLMLVVGQPKNTAEYIQASSRVGRAADRPGLVVSLGNWARPRDLAHFEQFRHYHETFYRQVEALSVTPYSPTSIDRGLDGVLVSTTRVREASVPGGLSPERAAGLVEKERAAVVAVIEALVARAARSTDEDGTEQVRRALVNRLDQWVKRRGVLAEKAQQLVYERGPDDKQYGPLMNSPENARALPDRRDAPPFVVANSMREVQPEINLLVSPIEENLVYVAPFTAPTWRMPGAES